MRWFSKSARLPKKRTKHPKSTHFSVPLGGAGIYIYTIIYPLGRDGRLSTFSALASSCKGREEVGVVGVAAAAAAAGAAGASGSLTWR